MTLIRRPDGTPVRQFRTVVEMLYETAREYPDVVAVRHAELAYTFAEFTRAVDGLAATMAAHGVGGKPVVIVLRNSIELAICICAAHRARAMSTTLNPDYTARELAQMIDIAGPALIIVDAEQHAKLDTDTPVLCLPVQTAEWVADLTRTDALGMQAPDPADIATLQFTGGTTGIPKAVKLSHRAIAINIAQREALLPTERGDERIVCMMPLFHVFAVAMCLHLAINAAGTLVILERYHPERLIENIERSAVTRLPAGPTVFASLLNYEAFDPGKLATVRCAYSGSAPLPSATMERWLDHTGIPIFEGYGQSETGPVLSFNSPFFPVRVGTVGKPVPATELEIVDAVGGTEIFGAGETGEIRVRGPQVMDGYLNRPEETASTLRSGWLYTGDLGALDGDGYLSIQDRKKDMVIVSGFNVYPREIDDLLARYPGVAEAAVVGIPDSYRGERLCAYIVRSDPTLAEEGLEAYCVENLVHYKVPSNFVFVEALPRTTVGKIDKKALRDPGVAGEQS